MSLSEFSVQPVFDHLCDRRTIDGDARPLESLRIGDDRRVRICVIPKGSVVNNNSRTR